MEMQYFWVGDKVAQDMYTMSWRLGQENLAGYQSKHHIDAHHQAVRPWYLHQADSSRVIPWALKPSTLKGCVGTVNNGYLRKVLLPQVPRDQSTIHVACTVGKSKRDAFTHIVSKQDAFIDRYTVNPHANSYLPNPRILGYDNLKRLLLDVSKLVLASLSPRWLM